MNSFSDRLKEAMEIRKIKPSELSEKSNIPKSAISQYLSGLYEAKQKSIFKLSKVLNVSEAWLMGLDVPMDTSNKIFHIPDKTIKIPLLGRVAAGEPIYADENIIGYEEIDASWAGEFFALKVKGNSMFPYILENDTLIVRKQNDVENGDIAVILINGEEATVKQVFKTTEGITLTAFNVQEWQPRFYTNKEIEELPITIVARFAQLRRDKLV